MDLVTIPAPKGATRKKKYLGRGSGSGTGKTSARGHKGQGQRAGRDFRPGLEGGSMPLIRRLPKRGFRSYPKVYQIIHIDDLNRFSKGTTVTSISLKEEGLIKDKAGRVKILSDGELKKILHIKVNAASQKAIKKIQESGSTIELVN